MMSKFTDHQLIQYMPSLDLAMKITWREIFCNNLIIYFDALEFAFSLHFNATLTMHYSSTL